MILNSDQEWFTREQDSMQGALTPSMSCRSTSAAADSKHKKNMRISRAMKGLAGAPMSVCPCVCACIPPVL